MKNPYSKILQSIQVYFPTHRSAIFLLHIALEIPVAIQGVWNPASLPFLQLNNTTVVILKVRSQILLWFGSLIEQSCQKLYSALVLASCITSLLCFSLPGKSTLRLCAVNIIQTNWPRISAWKASTRDRLMYLPQRSIYDSLPISPIYPTHIWISP